MNYKIMGRFLAMLLLVESIFMLPALAISLLAVKPLQFTAFYWPWALWRWSSVLFG